jgi:hypothetical protein
MAQMFAYFGLIEDTKAIRMATVKSVAMVAEAIWPFPRQLDTVREFTAG